MTMKIREKTFKKIREKTFNYGYHAFAGMGLNGPVFAPEDGSGESTDTDNSPENENGNEETENNEQNTTNNETNDKNGPTDAEAKLLKENMRRKRETEELKARLDKYKDINLEEVNELLTEREKAKLEAQKAEEERLREAGEWDKLKETLIKNAKEEQKVFENKLKEKEEEAASYKKTINNLTVGSAFDNSSFLSEKTILTPKLARLAYSEYFDVVNGKIVPFDAPRGDEDRSPLINSVGEPLPFEAAIEKIVDKDPDKDNILRSKRKSGSGQGSRNNGGDGLQRNTDTTPNDPLSRIAMGLKSIKRQTSGLENM